MKNIFQNKKVLISIIIAVVVIVIAIVLFVVLGKSGKDEKVAGNSVIKFSDDKNSGNSTGKVLDNKKDNEVSNNTENKVENKVGNTSVDPIIGSDVEDFYVEATEKFTKAFMDETEMQDLIDNNIDMKAFVAYGNVNGDEKRFLDEYNSLADDDPKIEETKQACLAVPSSYKMMISFMDMAIQMAKQAGDMATNTTDDNSSIGISSNSNVDLESITEEDKKLVIKEIANPEKSEDDENITKIKITYSWMQEEVDLYMVFYGDVIIFICDEEGTSLAESGTSFSGLDEEN